MKFEVVKREVFEKTDGPICGGRGTPQETLDFLDKLRKLPSDSILLVEIAKGENIDAVRARLYARSTTIKKKFKPGFVVRFAMSQDKRNIVIWKELPATK